LTIKSRFECIFQYFEYHRQFCSLWTTKSIKQQAATLCPTSETKLQKVAKIQSLCV